MYVLHCYPEKFALLIFSRAFFSGIILDTYRTSMKSLMPIATFKQLKTTRLFSPKIRLSGRITKGNSFASSNEIEIAQLIFVAI